MPINDAPVGSKPWIERRALVAGAGIAGLSAALFLLRGGVRQVLVFDKESVPFSGSSGRSAGIFRPLEGDRELVRLAARSRDILRELELESGLRLLHSTGLALVSDDEHELSRIRAASRAEGISSQQWLTDEPEVGPTLRRALLRLPATKRPRHILFSEDGGVIDTGALGQVLWREVKALGGEIRMRTEVSRLDFDEAGAALVTTTRGSVESVDVVVIAAGAGSGRLGLRAGSPMPLIPIQRHLALLESAQAPEAHEPVVWDLQPGVYYRPESGDLLACCCDEEPQPAAQPLPSLLALSDLGTRLRADDYRVKRYWAGLRTKAPDGRAIIGADPELAGLFWIAGLGGFGMTCGLAAGELLAQVITLGRGSGAHRPTRYRLSASGLRASQAVAS
jgi:D-arginine dehydrogenase